MSLPFRNRFATGSKYLTRFQKELMCGCLFRISRCTSKAFLSGRRIFVSRFAKRLRNSTRMTKISRSSCNRPQRNKIYTLSASRMTVLWYSKISQISWTRDENRCLTIWKRSATFFHSFTSFLTRTFSAYWITMKLEPYSCTSSKC
jgi:hypothetical protein